jgi:hypothetical protein
VRPRIGVVALYLSRRQGPEAEKEGSDDGGV